MGSGKPLTPSLTVTEAGVVRRYRELPLKGAVLVKVGQWVRADDVIAQAESPGELVILRIPERLGIEAEAVSQGLKVRLGEEVARGQLLCEHRGLFGIFKSRFFAPLDGVVEVIQEATGHLGLRGAAQQVAVDAYVAGRIVEILPGRGAVVEARGAFVQGIFGVGGERRGVISVVTDRPDEVITERLLQGQALEGRILVGGRSIERQALELAVQQGVVGVVTGSIDDETLRGYLGFDLGVAITGDEAVFASLICTEGLGSLAMSDRTFNLLRRYAGCEASINGATQIRAGAMRPEVIISSKESEGAGGAKGESEAVELARELQVGSGVRLIRFPYFGELGTVEALAYYLHRIDTGDEARVF